MMKKSILTVVFIALATLCVSAQSTRGGSNTRRTTNNTNTDSRATTIDANKQATRHTDVHDNKSIHYDSHHHDVHPHRGGPVHPSRTTYPDHMARRIINQPAPHVGYHPTPVIVSGPQPVTVVPYATPVVPAPGTIVEVLPAGCVNVNVGGVNVYVSTGVRYTPIWIGGRLYYKVL